MYGVTCATTGSRALNAVAKPSPSGARAHCFSVGPGLVGAEETSVIWPGTLWMEPFRHADVPMQLFETEQPALTAMHGRWPGCEVGGGPSSWAAVPGVRVARRGAARANWRSSVRWSLVLVAVLVLAGAVAAVVLRRPRTPPPPVVVPSAPAV